MTFFPNSKGIQFFLSEMIFRIHPTLTSIPLPQGISSNLSVEIPMILDPLTDYLMMQVEFFPL